MACQYLVADSLECMALILVAQVLQALQLMLHIFVTHKCDYVMRCYPIIVWIAAMPVTSYLFVLSFAILWRKWFIFCANEKVITVLFLFVFVYTLAVCVGSVSMTMIIVFCSYSDGVLCRRSIYVLYVCILGMQLWIFRHSIGGIVCVP